MKKLFFAFVAFAAMGLASCSKCGKCTLLGISGPEYCQKNGQEVYDAAKTSCTLSGGTWTE